VSTIEARFKGRLGRFVLDAAFTCPATGVTGLFGPSGCGKTTILRCFAGLTRLGDGYLNIAGAIWQDEQRFLKPYKRPVGYVFQDARLFPHLSVRGNLQYGLKRAGSAAPAITEAAVIELLALERLLPRAPAMLSGGERQRVAIGRALLAQPRLLLMDEPLSALDAPSKREILPYLEALARSLSVPILYVSHDVAEIERLADHLILMTAEGGIETAGPLGVLLTDLSLSLVRLPDPTAVIEAKIVAYDPAYDLSACDLGGAQLLVPGALGAAGIVRRLLIRASDVSLAKEMPQATSVLNILPARIVSAEAIGTGQMLVLIALDGGGGQLLSSVTRKSWDRLALASGSAVFAQIKGVALADRRN
jgi:molybdate transport system ATP-binding protein